MIRREKPWTATFSHNEWYGNLTTGSVWVNNTVRTNRSVVDYREGDVLPSWKDRIAKGLDATTTLIAERRTLQAFPIEKTNVLSWKWYWWNPAWGYDRRTISGCFAKPEPIGWDIANYPFQLTDAEALAKLYQAIQDRRMQFSGGVFLGELRETVRSLRRPLQGFQDGIRKYLNDVRNVCRGKRPPLYSQRYKHLLDALSSLWLETAYSLRPMVSDIEDAKKALIEMHSREERATVRVSKQRVNSTVSFNPDIREFGGWTGVVARDRRTTHAVRVVYRAGLNLTVADAPLGSGARWRQRFGLTIDQFVPTVWDLIPFSMVADYLSNLGDILTALSFDRRGVLWVNRTIIYESSVVDILTQDTAKTYSNQFSGGATPGEVQLTQYFGSSTSTLTRIARSSTGLIIPSLNFRTPAADSRKWINMAALAVQLGIANRSVRSYLNG